MHSQSSRSQRRAYLDWIEEQVETFKDSVPRSQLLEIAEEVIEELRVSPRGQYQLTELLLCEAVDRKIIRSLRLPGYRAWRAREAEPRAEPEVPDRDGPDVLF